ncbi:MAG TPA: hypothetical protein VJZ71_04605 [Phycisphaerae bacterium]|nr:hypothetical protein [Phycisphaerae bacterium]
MRINPLAVVLTLLASGQHLSAEPAKQTAPFVEAFLFSGDLAGGEKALTDEIKKTSDADGLNFQLGTLQFIRAVERLSQTLYGYGFNERVGMASEMVGIPIPHQPKPKTISYDDCRKIMETWVADLQRAEETLAGVKDPDVKMPLHFAMIRLDLDGDGKAAEEETIWRVFARLGGAPTPEGSAALVIDFDRADALWLRGYCHLLMALGDFVLAYDFRELFERTGHLIFAKVKSPYDYLQTGPKVFEMASVDIADVIAFIHLLNFPLKDAERTKSALAHLQSMTKLSREMWKLVIAETDSGSEWIPNPKQTSVVPGGAVTEEMTKDWIVFLDELDAILAGKKLIPFWRTDDGRGLNLHRILNEPQAFDLVLWIQGSAAAPYLEKGLITSPEVWQRLQRTFQGNFIGFAVWFN